MEQNTQSPATALHSNLQLSNQVVPSWWVRINTELQPALLWKRRFEWSVNRPAQQILGSELTVPRLTSSLGCGVYISVWSAKILSKNGQGTFCRHIQLLITNCLVTQIPHKYSPNLDDLVESPKVVGDLVLHLGLVPLCPDLCDHLWTIPESSLCPLSVAPIFPCDGAWKHSFWFIYDIFHKKTWSYKIWLTVKIRVITSSCLGLVRQVRQLGMSDIAESWSEPCWGWIGISAC